MNSTWQEFLTAQGASIDDNGYASFGTSADDCVLMDLSWLGILQVSGEDSVDFLQGQLTNDLRELTATHSQLNAYCTPKGRMLASFRSVARGDDILLLMPRERLAAVHKRLQMFVLRSQVQLADAGEQLGCIGLSGDCVDQLLPSLPHDSDAVAQSDGLTQVRVAGEQPRALVIGPFEQLQALWRQARDAGASPVDSSHWRLLDIRAGLPNVFDATAEAFVPQMTNLQLLNGVSFTKGCYTGQEVVARMHYLGKLKRRMYRATADNASAAPGEALFSAASQSGQGAGQVVDAQPDANGRLQLLVVAESARAEANDLHLGDADGPQLDILPPPYPLDDDSNEKSG